MLRSGLLVLSLAGLMLPAGQALAGGKAPFAIMPGFCKLPDANGSSFTDQQVKETIVNTPSGVANLECHGTVPNDTLPQTAVQFDFTSTGAVCGTPFGSTLVWHAVVTPSGEVTLICQIKRT
jgi:hypothetical protein